MNNLESLPKEEGQRVEIEEGRERLEANLRELAANMQAYEAPKEDNPERESAWEKIVSFAKDHPFPLAAVMAVGLGIFTREATGSPVPGWEILWSVVGGGLGGIVTEKLVAEPLHKQNEEFLKEFDRRMNLEK